MMVPSLSNRMPRIAIYPPPRLNGPSGRAHRAWLPARMDRKIADGRRRARQRVVGVPGHLDVGEAGGARIPEQQPAGQALADADNLLENLGRLQSADDA